MATRSVRVILEEMLQAISTAEELTADLDYDAYASDGHRGRRMGVERCIEIISEASRHIPDDVRSAYPEVPWPKVRDIGNILRHGYWSIDNLIVWRVVTLSLPELRTVLESMLTRLPPDPSEIQQ